MSKVMCAEFKDYLTGEHYIQYREDKGNKELYRIIRKWYEYGYGYRTETVHKTEDREEAIYFMRTLLIH